MSAASRSPFIDTLKALASQLIVLHHLAFYGPMSDKAYELAPTLLAWLSDYGRMAVQAFLVLGGFLAAKSLAPQGRIVLDRPLDYVIARYFRLVLPYTAALALAIGAAMLARYWMDHDSIPARPFAAQIMAHLLLLQNVLGYDALSAGVWYVAIDFQLTVLLVVLLWLTRGSRYFGMALVLALGAASLFHFNRDAGWDNWALYFFGSYALGAAAWWTIRRSWHWLAALMLVGAIGLLVDFRPRILVALAVALSLALAYRMEITWPRSRVLDYFGRISYSVFLVHFSVLLVLNAAFARFVDDTPAVNALGMLLAWAASVAVGGVFYKYIEKPAFDFRNLFRKPGAQKDAA